MTTHPELTQESLPTDSDRSAVLRTHYDRLSPRLLTWLIVSAYLVVNAVMLVGTTVAAIYLGTIVPGVAGTLVIFTVGIALVAAAPTVTRLIFERVFLTPRERSLEVRR